MNWLKQYFQMWKSAFVETQMWKSAFVETPSKVWQEIHTVKLGQPHGYKLGSIVEHGGQQWLAVNEVELRKYEHSTVPANEKEKSI